MSASSPIGRVRLVASDLDGTLLRGDGTLSERTLEAVIRVTASGVGFVILTARSPRGLAPEAERLGVELAICCNGAVTYDFALDRPLHERTLPHAVARRLIESVREAAPGVALGWEHRGGFDAERHYVPLYVPPEQIPRADPLALEFLPPLTKLVLQHHELDQSELHDLTAELCGEHAVATYSGARLVEIAAAGVTKASALAELCAERDIDRGEVLAFGDMPNDVPMLLWAGRGVAVANAHPDALAAADEVTGSNDEDGVAAVLERLPAGRSGENVS
ncbi:MAG: HAD family hydrolase [Gaiellaceae bacterium]